MIRESNHICVNFSAKKKTHLRLFVDIRYPHFFECKIVKKTSEILN